MRNASHRRSHCIFCRVTWSSRRARANASSEHLMTCCCALPFCLDSRSDRGAVAIIFRCASHAHGLQIMMDRAVSEDATCAVHRLAESLWKTSNLSGDFSIFAMDFRKHGLRVFNHHCHCQLLQQAFLCGHVDFKRFQQLCFSIIVTPICCSEHFSVELSISFWIHFSETLFVDLCGTTCLTWPSLMTTKLNFTKPFWSKNPRVFGCVPTCCCVEWQACPRRSL